MDDRKERQTMRNAILTLLLFGLLAASANPAAFYEGLTAARLRGNAVPLSWESAGLNTGLVGYWAMRTNTATTVFDEWGTNTATAVNGVMFGSAYGKRDEGAGFVTNYIEAANSSGFAFGSGSFSVAAWVRQSATNGNQAIVEKRGSVTPDRYRGFVLLMAGGFPRFIVTGDDQGFFEVGVASASSVPTGQWSHVVGVCNRSTSNVLLYVNGTLAGSAALNANVGSVNNASPLRVGYKSTTLQTSVTYFQGAIDEIPIWNRALSSNEVYLIGNTNSPLYAPYKP